MKKKLAILMSLVLCFNLSVAERSYAGILDSLINIFGGSTTHTQAECPKNASDMRSTPTGQLKCSVCGKIVNSNELNNTNNQPASSQTPAANTNTSTAAVSITQSGVEEALIHLSQLVREHIKSDTTATAQSEISINRLETKTNDSLSDLEPYYTGSDSFNSIKEENKKAIETLRKYVYKEASQELELNRAVSWCMSPLYIADIYNEGVKYLLCHKVTKDYNDSDCGKMAKDSKYLSGVNILETKAEANLRFLKNLPQQMCEKIDLGQNAVTSSQFTPPPSTNNNNTGNWFTNLFSSWGGNNRTTTTDQTTELYYMSSEQEGKEVNDKSVAVSEAELLMKEYINVIYPDRFVCCAYRIETIPHPQYDAEGHLTGYTYTYKCHVVHGWPMTLQIDQNQIAEINRVTGSGFIKEDDVSDNAFRYNSTLYYDMCPSLIVDGNGAAIFVNPEKRVFKYSVSTTETDRDREFKTFYTKWKEYSASNKTSGKNLVEASIPFFDVNSDLSESTVKLENIKIVTNNTKYRNLKSKFNRQTLIKATVGADGLYYIDNNNDLIIVGGNLPLMGLRLYKLTDNLGSNIQEESAAAEDTQKLITIETEDGKKYFSKFANVRVISKIRGSIIDTVKTDTYYDIFEQKFYRYDTKNNHWDEIKNANATNNDNVAKVTKYRNPSDSIAKEEGWYVLAQDFMPSGLAGSMLCAVYFPIYKNKYDEVPEKDKYYPTGRKIFLNRSNLGVQNDGTLRIKDITKPMAFFSDPTTNEFPTDDKKEKLGILSTQFGQPPTN